MLPEITIRLTITANACPIGPRLERGTPLPPYQHTYALEERQQAEADMDRVRKYIEQHHGKPKKK
jgi:hypothetical protein